MDGWVKSAQIKIELKTVKLGVCLQISHAIPKRMNTATSQLTCGSAGCLPDDPSSVPTTR
jgi:hypothetical protein